MHINYHLSLHCAHCHNQHTKEPVVVVMTCLWPRDSMMQLGTIASHISAF